MGNSRGDVEEKRKATNNMSTIEVESRKLSPHFIPAKRRKNTRSAQTEVKNHSSKGKKETSRTVQVQESLRLAYAGSKHSSCNVPFCSLIETVDSSLQRCREGRNNTQPWLLDNNHLIQSHKVQVEHAIVVQANGTISRARNFSPRLLTKTLVLRLEQGIVG